MKIVITGATSGIGRQLALDYKKEGHDIWVAGRNEKALNDLRKTGIEASRVNLTDRSETLTSTAPSTRASR